MTGKELVYRYDGSFEGLLCCIFESFVHKEHPVDILSQEEAQGLLYPERWIETDEAHADRVFISLRRKISAEASRLVQEGFLTCAPQKELMLYRYVCLGYRYGAAVTNMLTNNAVNKAVQHLGNEAHLLKGFIRFSEHAGALTSVITPKNWVLPLLQPHFCDRYPQENFLIYDATHRSALLSQRGEWAIAPLDSFEPPPPDLKEAAFRALWKRFYDTIAIEGRYNPRCRMSHMPKRYWGNMTEHCQQQLPQQVTMEMLRAPSGAQAVPSGTAENSRLLRPQAQREEEQADG